MQIFYLREADSDVASNRVLSPSAGEVPVQLDYTLAAAEALNVKQAFITSLIDPGSEAWPAGDYDLTFVVKVANQVSYQVTLFHCDKDGNDIAQLGSTGILTGVGIKIVAISGLGAPDATKTDRFKVKIEARNDDAVNAQKFSFITSQSGIVTPITARRSVGGHGGYIAGSFMKKLSPSWKRSDEDLDSDNDDQFIVESVHELDEL